MLRARERAVLEALLPTGAHEKLPGVLESGFETFLQEFEAAAAPPMRLGFKAALWTGAWISPLLIRRLPPITRLAPQEREKALDSLGASRFYTLRQMLLLLKAVVSFHYGADRRVREAIGFYR